MITEITGKCSYEGCEAPAECIAVGKSCDGPENHPEPACYCLTHGRVVENEGNPEYTHVCPNCGCWMGIN